MKYISGNSNATLSDLDALAQTSSTYGEIYNGYTSANMRSNTLSAGTEGSISYVAKSSSQDIQVTLGGLDWECVYLSKDINGNTILTLWLDNSVQDAWSNRSATEGQVHGFLNGCLFSEFSYNWSNTSYAATYPSNMYGTSYIHCRLLNNGGYGAISRTEAYQDTVAPDSNSAFAMFTMSEYGLTDYLVTPRSVAWQLSQSAKTVWGTQYNYPNEACGKDLNPSDFARGDFNYSRSKTYGDAWADAYVWIPSATEVGFNSSGNGMWKTSDTQRMNYDGTTVGASSSIGTLGISNAATGYWLRTGYSASSAKTILGETSDGAQVVEIDVSWALTVRPCLHLNLSAMRDHVLVDELYDEKTKSFNEDNINVLMRYISGFSKVSLGTLDTLAQTSSSYGTIFNGYSAADMRANEYSGKKRSGQDIVVTLGGLKWQVEYLSKDKSGNTILTLWLDNCVQDAWSDTTKYTSIAGEYYGFIRGGLYSTWSYGWVNSRVGTYPSNMYGTSYMNAVVLNNGGTYADSLRTSMTAYQSESSPFALFTMSQYGLTDYLVTPSKVSWQETQSAKTTTVMSYNLPNDAWSSSMTDNFYTSAYGLMNYASKFGNNNWANSYLWLPSLTETGYSTTKTGIWETSIAQRQNHDGSTTSSLGSVGTSSKSASVYSWLRSGDYQTALRANILHPSGSGKNTNFARNAFAVRPALHLNITKIFNYFANYVTVSELYDSDNRTINKDNVNILMKYISGNSSATISTLDTLAQTSSSYGSIYNGYTSANMRANTLSAGSERGVSYSAKSNSQDIQVRLGGLDWQVQYLSKDKNGNTILTLWLDNCLQFAWKDRSSTEGAYYGFLNGGLYSRWSNDWYSSTVGNYPSNMYGTSYIHAVTLNNGGTYATSTTASATATQSTSSPFALYTMPQYGLTNYLVTPSQVGWQESQSAKTIINGEYNLPNDAWSSSMTEGFYTNSDYGYMNYASKAGNDYWADDYLWLPSLTETGDAFNAGMWETSTTQKQNYDGSTTSSLGKVGFTSSNRSTPAFADSWLRSGDDTSASYANCIDPSSGSSFLLWSYGNLDYPLAVRPALHLNLTAIVDEFTDYVQVGELYDEETKTINYTNLDIMYKYLTGDANATYATVSSRGWADSQDIGGRTLNSGTHNGTAYGAKKSDQDVVVRLGGLDWYVVMSQEVENNQYYLTFYLKGGAQEKWLDSARYSSKVGEYYGFIDGVLYADYSANFQSTNTSNAYPSNMYGTSYMNAVVLNNGGTFATSNTTSATATQSSSSPFALYTMASGGLTKYLVATKDHYYDSELFATYAEGPSGNVFQVFCHPNEDILCGYGGEWGMPLHSKYLSNENYCAWGSSYLWLPSALHITAATGWNLSIAQMSNGVLTDSFAIMGKVGAKSENAYASSWLRTGHGSRAYMAYTMLADGTDYGTSGVGSAHAVRPALYFNLTAVEADRPSASAVNSQSLGEKIFESNRYVSFNDVAMTNKKVA